MPELLKEDVKDFSLAKVREEMKSRHSRLEEIRTQNQGDLTKAEGDHGKEAAAAFRELNVLGERHDELAPIEVGESKLASLGEWLNAPAGEIPVPGTKADEKPAFKDATDFILESAGYKRYKETGERNFSVEMPFEALYGAKDFKLLGELVAGNVTDQFAPQAVRLPGVTVPVLFQQNNMAPTFLQGTTDQNAIPYMVETVTSEGAAETAEAATKPEADISFVEASSPVQNIAVTLPVTNQLLEDVGFMRAYVEGRLRIFVENRLDRQLISGDGIAPNLTGILTVGGVGVESFSLAAHAADGTVGIDSIYRAMADVRGAFLDPSSVGMRAATWTLFQLAKDANSNYILGGPGQTAAPRVWGVPVIQNERFPAAAAAAEAIAVWAREAAMVVRRNAISLAVSDSHASTFTANVLTFRAEQRVAFPIFRPAGISVVTTAA